MVHDDMVLAGIEPRKEAFRDLSRAKATGVEEGSLEFVTQRLRAIRSPEVQETSAANSRHEDVRGDVGSLLAHSFEFQRQLLAHRCAGELGDGVGAGIVMQEAHDRGRCGQDGLLAGLQGPSLDHARQEGLDDVHSAEDVHREDARPGLWGSLQNHGALLSGDAGVVEEEGDLAVWEGLLDLLRRSGALLEVGDVAEHGQHLHLAGLALRRQLCRGAVKLLLRDVEERHRHTLAHKPQGNFPTKAGCTTGDHRNAIPVDASGNHGGQ
mmetsp:Transcript_81043/g.177956  ORF Transcript_81043/g.177956 Transcript_81043/m.177956 type:complete len:267 (-) Transcript_81043:54-854(-)